MSERSERNRKIAEWLGFEEIECRIEHHGPQCWRFNGDHILRLPDFYTSEEANAAVLEKLIMSNCRVLIDRGGTTIYGPPQPDDVVVLYDARGRRFDLELWRTAICEGALRLIEETGGQR